MKIISKITDALFFVVPVLLFLIWINGSYHGSKRHDIDPLDNTFDFFKSFYYGVEYFVHPLDKSELNDYIKLSGSIIVNSETNLNTNQNFEIVRSKKLLNKFLNRATKEEYNYIKNGVYYYVKYLNLRHKDIVNELLSRKKITLKISDSTKYYSKLSSKHGFSSEINMIASYYKKLAFDYNQTLKSNDKKIIRNRKVFINQAFAYYKSSIIKRKENFHHLFVD
jgi:hypothetical protein